MPAASVAGPSYAARYLCAANAYPHSVRCAFQLATHPHVLLTHAPHPRPQVDPNRAACRLRNSYACQRCPTAFQARTPIVSTAPIAEDGNILLPLLFKEPVQLSAIYIKQIRKPSLLKVGLPIIMLQPVCTASAQESCLSLHAP